MNPHIREYSPEDKEAVVRIFRLNTPAFFAPAELEGFPVAPVKDC